MSFWQELASWKTPPISIISDPPRVGVKAPSRPPLELPADSKVIVRFLRHCGCPFAEKAYRDLANHPAIQSGEVTGIVVSHSSEEATNKWIEALQNDPKQPGSDAQNPAPVRVVVDEDRRSYAAWGLGVSSLWHVLSPATIASVVNLGRGEGIWNRPTESGSRWQTAGDFAVDSDGVVKWVHVYEGAGMWEMSMRG
ncbi:hypothetical protein P170DRAFT_468201 [Aspergillus steynii IBT 23096]|uniref:Uncharacterized protein n=1 Tax=Aspergillus steynii IBT 23096 TaxID=1392250 RepID=A0A2I2FV72_9EURO|nr:uncharacterized protein P170DRAFT_468201 [Aspergillus steynii IBT 23096]PLB44548.1 hypothetical protein P170DRAFT_468201 [Aspergillus steynii IBT 23096]